MQLHITVPLAVNTADKRSLELMPVVMDVQHPSDEPEMFVRFIKPEGERIPLSPIEVSRVLRYMRQNKSDAVSEDGVQAFTIAGNALLECLPEVCMNATAE